jgi:hypothetical protein
MANSSNYFSNTDARVLGNEQAQNYMQQQRMAQGAAQNRWTPRPAMPPTSEPAPAQAPAPVQFAPRVPAPVATQMPTTLENVFYIPGILRSFVGQMVRLEFLIGTSGPLIDRTGTLVEVGANYVIIQPIESDDLLVCDLFAIKFVNVLR